MLRDSGARRDWNAHEGGILRRKEKRHECAARARAFSDPVAVVYAVVNASLLCSGCGTFMESMIALNVALGRIAFEVLSASG